MNRAFLAILTLLWSLTAVSALDLPQQFEQALNASKAGNYEQAIELYEAIAKARPGSAVHYNLANAYLKNKQLGKAILHYERALRIRKSPDIRHNLQAAEARIVDRILPYNDMFILRAWHFLRDSLQSGTWAGIGLVCWAAAMVGLALWLHGSSRSWRKRGFVGGITAWLLAMLFLGLSYHGYHIQNMQQWAVVTATATPLRSAPDAAGSDILSLTEGNKVRILETVGQWGMVSLVNGEQGWLQLNSVEKI